MVVQERYEIFRGRGVKYNKSVLRTLFEKGRLSSWKLAKEIARNDPKRKGDWYHETQKVQSVLVRKAGVLHKLMDRDYVQKIDHEYALTFPKGFAITLVLNAEMRLPKYDIANMLVQKVDKRLRSEWKDLMDVYSELYTEKERYDEVRRIALKLLERGLNPNVLTNYEFNAYLLTEIEQDLMSKTQEKGSLRTIQTNPKLYEKCLKLLKKTREVMVEEFSKLDEMLKSLEKELENRAPKGAKIND